MAFELANWIWTEKVKSNHYVDFIDYFNVDNNESCILNICAKTNYAVYINGVFVDCDQYHDFPDRKVYDVLNVDKFVKKGKNKLAIIGYSSQQNTASHISNGVGLIYSVSVGEKTVAFSSVNTLCREDVCYESGEMGNITNQLGYRVSANLTKYDNWIEEDFNGSGFEKSVICDEKALFIPRPIKKLKIENNCPSTVYTQGVFRYSVDGNVGEKLQNAYLSAKYFDRISDKKDAVLFDLGNDPITYKTDSMCDGIYFVADIKKETAGYLSFDITVKEDCTLQVAYGEHLDDLRVRTSIDGRNFTMTYRLKKGKNEFVERFRRIAGRYLQFYVETDELTVKKAGICEALYPLEVLPFKTNDYIANKIYETCVNTLRCCMHEHYEDCPMREQAQYVMDSRIQMLCGYHAFGEYEFARAALVTMGHELNEDEYLCITSPCRGDLHIPCFSLCYFLAVKEYISYSKDLTIIPEIKENLARLFETFSSQIDENGLIPQINAWNFYEWTEGLGNDTEYFGGSGANYDYHAPLNAFFVIAAKSYAEILLSVGENASAEKVIALAKKCEDSLYKTFWNEEKGVFATYIKDGKISHYAEYTQIILLYAGFTSDARAKKLCETVTSNNDLVKLSLTNYAYKYDVLLRFGKEYVEYVRRDIEEHWGKMLFNGATSFYETELGSKDFHYAGSCCHGWSAIPAYVYRAYKIYND